MFSSLASTPGFPQKACNTYWFQQENLGIGGGSCICLYIKIEPLAQGTGPFRGNVHRRAKRADCEVLASRLTRAPWKRGLGRIAEWLPCHRLTWKCTDPCKKITFLLERGFVHFHVSWWEGYYLVENFPPLVGYKQGYYPRSDSSQAI